jgi:hypothetical protein
MVVSRDRMKAQAAEALNYLKEEIYDLNELGEVDAMNLKEFIISGAAVWKIGYDYFPSLNREDGRVDAVNPSRMFFNPVTDPRISHDLRLIGELIDVPIDDLVAAFAQNEDDEKYIKKLYSEAEENIYDYVKAFPSQSKDQIDNLDFFLTQENNKVRLFEIWEFKREWRTYVHDYADASYTISNLPLEYFNQINQQRILEAQEEGRPQPPLIEARRKYEGVWYVKYLTPTGHILHEQESPYIHEGHPYILFLYPLIDGEVWGLVEDIIDQQRYINRLIALLDFIMGASAKGVLLVPEDSIPDDMNIEDFADEWSKFNGVVKIKQKPGQSIPQQISSNATNVGAHELLSMQLKMIQEISGVNSAIQGQAAKAGTPAALYDQQANLSSLNSQDMMTAFNHAIKKRDFKMLKTVLQFTQDKRYIQAKNSTYNLDTLELNPEEIRGLSFDVTMAMSTDTPSYRQVLDETLTRLLEGGHIDLPMYLKHTSLPFADKLLQEINNRQGQDPNKVINEAAGQMAMQENTGQNPEFQQMVEQMKQ